MGFCSLIDPADHSLGCVERVPNYFESTFYHDEATFNPFYPNYDYTYLSLWHVENLDRVTRFTDSKIASIELCELSVAGQTDQIGMVILTMQEGQVYEFYDRGLDRATDITTPCAYTYTFTTTMQPVAVYGDHDATNSIDYLGFMYYNSAAAALCDCDNTFISGTPLIENSEVTILDSETITVDTSAMKDTVSVDRFIKNFCGEYSFTLDTNPTGGQMETWITTSTTGFYDDYSIATIAPTESYNYGTYKMTLGVGLAGYPTVAADETNFEIDVLACETRFEATP